jgi:flavorubredoxin
MNAPELPIRMLAPEKVADDTYVVRQLANEGHAPVATFMNSAVITGAEPVIIDTGAAATRDVWLDTTFSIVAPEDVRWIYLSHDDHDHVGNLLQVLALCPQATLVTSWFMVERMASEFGMQIPMDRMLWLNDGQSFDAGDRTFTLQVPPTFDSPTTRGLHDSKTGVYWAADSMGTPVTHEVTDINELPPGFFREGFTMMQRILSPWHQWLDPIRYGAHLDQVRSLDPQVVISGHGPALRGNQIESAFNLLTEVPYLQAAPLPGQADLEQILASIQAGAVAEAPAADDDVAEAA